ncbi:hypothetical protein KIPB_012089, partial [Kipferlia bialata]
EGPTYTSGPISVRVRGEGQGERGGIVATGSIKRGQMVLREYPIILLPKDDNSVTVAGTEKCLKELPQELQDAFWALSDRAEAERERDRETGETGETKGPSLSLKLPKTLQGVITHNCFSCEDSHPPPFHNCVCLTASRFNHSCVPNVTRYWNSDENAMVFHASRDIEAGEELFISRVPIKACYAERQRLLREACTECRCALCTASEEERAVHDALCAQDEAYLDAVETGMEELDFEGVVSTLKQVGA